MFRAFWQQHGYASDPPEGTDESYWLKLRDPQIPGQSLHPGKFIMDAMDFHLRCAADLTKEGRQKEVKCPPVIALVDTVNRLAREYDAEWTRQNPRGEEIPPVEKVYARAHMNVAIIFLKTEVLTGDAKEMKKQEVLNAIGRIWNGPKTKDEKTEEIVGLVTRTADALQVRLNGWPNNPPEESGTMMRRNRDFKPVGGIVGKIMHDVETKGKVEIL